MLGPALIGRDERQVDVGLHHRGELHLGLLRRFLEPLQRHAILAEIDAVALPELGDDPVHHPLIEVVAAQMRVAVGRLDLDDALADLEDRDVKGAAAEVVHGDRLFLLLVETIGQRRRRRLVDDAHDLEAGNLTRVLGGLALGVVEVGRHRDDRLGDRLPEIFLGRLFQLLENHRGDFRRRHFLAVRRDPRIAVGAPYHLIRDHLHLLGHLVELPAHEPLDREHGVLGVGHGLPFGHLADEPLAVLGKADHRRRQAPTFRVGDDDRLAAFHHGDNRVRSAQVNSDDFAHVLPRSVSRGHARGGPSVILNRV